ncbi:MAG TPA: DUF2177 family protein [Candidatus Saccharimonadales bacterium]
MGNFLQLTAVAGITFVAIDALWLGVVARNLYRSHLGSMLREQPQMLAAAGFYILYILALVFFVIQPAIEKSSWQHALFAGAFFGLVAYATYDLTNLATLKSWPLKITIIDLAWGALISGIVSLAAYHVGKWLA